MNAKKKLAKNLNYININPPKKTPIDIDIYGWEKYDHHDMKKKAKKSLKYICV